MLIVSLLLALAPAVLLVLYFYRRDKNKPEPKKMILKAFFAGVLSIVPAVILAIFFQGLDSTPEPWQAVFNKSFLSAALVEEFSKLFVFWLFILNNPDFDEVTDGIVYMAIISLGFAAFENVLYSTGNILVGLMRAFTAVPGHALWSAVMGFFLGYSKMKKEGSPIYILIGLVLAVFYHGIYDFVLFAAAHPELTADFGWMVFLIIPVLIVSLIHCQILIKKALKIDIEAGFAHPLIQLKPVFGLDDRE
ncbi:MAG: PrsW family intramembrane metalloprotease [Spirochaetales bacterium]|nr:PrsW family intramembrane metalloprotease [Spirochaetales bacterium]